MSMIPSTFRQLCALFLLAFTAIAQAEKAQQPAHLFILSGQSNMAALNPARTFTPAVAEAFGADRVIVVKDAKGGEPIRRWHKAWRPESGEPPATTGALYERLMKKVRPAIEGHALLSVTFLWMQGERDAREGHGRVYQRSLEGVVQQIAGDLGRSDIHCVIGRLSDFDLPNRRYPHWTMVREAQMAFAAARPDRAWVDTDDLNDGQNARGQPIKNDLHYSPAGYDELGRRFAREAIRLVRTHEKPHVILVMADDHGWGDVGYNGHPFVRTPALDAMARDGFVFDRFYAAAPVCSPTRASVLTGRSPNRTRVTNHGRYMRPQEFTIAEALRAAGYVTGLFGKFHLGSAQPGSPCNPGAMGFEEWVVGLNFFDRDPFLSRQGVVEQQKGQGTVLAVDEALAFLKRHQKGERPTFTVVWFPSPHDPHDETPEGEALYEGKKHAGYFREITLLDQQLGRLRTALRDMGIAEKTILWYCSDNGGLVPESSGGRARKGSIYEGGLRVPAIIEWPGGALKGRSAVPSGTVDIFPTIASLTGIGMHAPHPIDGVDLREVLSGRGSVREKPMGFWHRIEGGQVTWSDRILAEIMKKQQAGLPAPHDAPRMQKDVAEFPQHDGGLAKGHAAWLDWPWKLHRIQGERYELYDLSQDPEESRDLSGDAQHAERAARMKAGLDRWMRSVVRSLNGKDYAGRQ